MGCGNVRVTGTYEGLFYIDNYDIHVYRRDEPFVEEPEARLLRNLSHQELTSGEWYYDDEGTGCEQEDIEECFMVDFMKMFPSFKRSEGGQWLDDARILMESNLFYITTEDNEWSMAVKLIQKEEPRGMIWMENLQKRLYKKYLDGMKKCLLSRLPSICIRTSAWTSDVIWR